MKPEGPVPGGGAGAGQGAGSLGSQSLLAGNFPTPGLLSGCRDAKGADSGSGAQEEGPGHLPHDTVVPGSFPARSAPPAVPVQGPWA